MTEKARVWFLELNKKTGNLLGFARADQGASKEELFLSEPPIGIEREIVKVIDAEAYAALKKECEELKAEVEKMRQQRNEFHDETMSFIAKGKVLSDKNLSLRECLKDVVDAHYGKD